ncbi:MAG: hypothetical protein HY897_00305 [Deltaproteobacteria bacterium]|nr:hypothetical protein [Deltaproteobacteria bacterium]
MDAQEVRNRFGEKGETVLVLLVKKPNMGTVDTLLRDSGITHAEILEIIDGLEKAGLARTERV